MQRGESAQSLEQLVARVIQALTVAGTLLSVSPAGATSSQEPKIASSTDSQWTSVATQSDPTSSRSAVARQTLASLQKTSRALRVIRSEFSSPGMRYLQALSDALGPYEDATELSQAQLFHIGTGLESAWSSLVADARGTPLLRPLADIDPGLEKLLDPVDRLGRHRTTPSVEGRADLSAVLVGTPGLEGLIAETLTAASNAFEDRATYRLEPFADPEPVAPTTAVHLVLLTSLSVGEANQRMDLLDEDWWLDNAHRADGRLTVALEYV